MSNFSNPIFHDETKAREWLEAELWPDGPVCPHCGTIGEATLLKGKSTRPGVYKCKACRRPFTVTVRTIYERSHIPLHKWLAATQLMMSSKKGMSALQIHRLLGITPRSAWFMCHRIRESLRETKPEALGGENRIVEVDETYVGGKEKNRHAWKRTGLGGAANKETVFSLVERGGRARSFHVASVSSNNLRTILNAQLHPETALMTDGAGQYRHMHKDFKHESVNHDAGEYVRGSVHTNTIENYFSIFKRGIIGTYHHVSQQHLKRYLAEFDFRYNERQALKVDDAQRMTKSVQGIVGKRLTYHQIGGGTNNDGRLE